MYICFICFSSLKVPSRDKEGGEGPCVCPTLRTEVVERKGSTSCPGDTVIITCTLPSDVHNWRIPSLGINVQVFEGLPLFNNSLLSIRRTSSFTSTLTVTSFAGLNGATVSCGNASTVVQQTAIRVDTCLICRDTKPKVGSYNNIGVTCTLQALGPQS